ncbi:MICOS complex subunit MIC13 homolog QIL1 [Anastrepha obliqua]|uniref:MICOS complex subunit MIC13 homolog QIL1 n=1 Tax=Anastrepha obliqua TaxID=95512 RepID=UPI00240A184F|nr:MICOS complex subunit MIC13 homolog QIL1 [Anastrepha obliqua]
MVISFLVRAGIIVGAVYYSKKQGVWGNTEESEKLYNKLKDGLRPHAKELERKLPFEVPALPESGEARFLAKHYYNEGVKNTFHFIEMIPCYTGQLMHKAKTEFEKFSQAPAPNTDK